MAKYIAVVLTALAMVVGAVFTLEDRYVSKSEAEVMIAKVEHEAVQTFQMFQREVQREQLEDLKDKKIIIERELERHPNDTYLKLRKEEIERKIKRLENKLDKDDIN